MSSVSSDSLSDSLTRSTSDEVRIADSVKGTRLSSQYGENTRVVNKLSD